MSVVESGRYQLMMCECMDALSWMNAKNVKEYPPPSFMVYWPWVFFFSRLPYNLSSKKITTIYYKSSHLCQRFSCQQWWVWPWCWLACPVNHQGQYTWCAVEMVDVACHWWPVKEWCPCFLGCLYGKWKTCNHWIISQGEIHSLDKLESSLDHGDGESY